jgi:hypothetical protein
VTRDEWQRKGGAQSTSHEAYFLVSYILVLHISHFFLIAVTITKKVVGTNFPQNASK